LGRAVPSTTSVEPKPRRTLACVLQISDAEESHMKGITWINLLLGIWLIIAPFVLMTTAVGSARWTGNDVVLGILLIAFSWWILAAYGTPMGAIWFQAVCGVWLIIAPFVLAYSATRVAMSNDIVSGIIAIIVAVIASRAPAKTPTAA
jgi:hypothetical protein